MIKMTECFGCEITSTTVKHDNKMKYKLSYLTDAYYMQNGRKPTVGLDLRYIKKK
jgi:hypothetical protein